MFCLQFVMLALRTASGGLQFFCLPSFALRSLALKMTLFVGGPWYVPLPRTRFSVACSCSDMNKGPTMPALLWVFSGSMQCLTRFAHARPSEDALHKRADLAAIQKRGRWRSPKSVVRYLKGAKLLRQLSFVSEQLLKKARSLEFQLPLSCR